MADEHEWRRIGAVPVPYKGCRRCRKSWEYVVHMADWLCEDYVGVRYAAEPESVPAHD